MNIRSTNICEMRALLSFIYKVCRLVQIYCASSVTAFIFGTWRDRVCRERSCLCNCSKVFFSSVRPMKRNTTVLPSPRLPVRLVPCGSMTTRRHNIPNTSLGVYLVHTSGSTRRREMSCVLFGWVHTVHRRETFLCCVDSNILSFLVSY